MANKPFDRMILNVRERPISSDINQGFSDVARTDIFNLIHPLFARFGPAIPLPSDISTKFLNGGFYVLATGSGMDVLVSAGLGVMYGGGDVPTDIDGVVGLSDTSTMKPLVLSATQTIAVPASDPTNPRIDIIEVRARRERNDPQTRDVFNPATEVFDPTGGVLKNLSVDCLNDTGVVLSPANSTASIGYKTGVPGSTPGIPATSPGYVKIAEIRVEAASTSVPANKVKDMRSVVGGQPGGIVVRGNVTWATNDPPGTAITHIVMAPPGVRVSAASPTGAAPATGFSKVCTLYIAAGAGITGSSVQITPSNNGNLQVLAQVESVTVMAADASIRTAMDGTAVNTESNPHVAVMSTGSGQTGQQVLEVIFRLSTVGAVALPNPVRADYTITLYNSPVV